MQKRATWADELDTLRIIEDVEKDIKSRRYVTSQEARDVATRISGHYTRPFLYCDNVRHNAKKIGITRPRVTPARLYYPYFIRQRIFRPLLEALVSDDDGAEVHEEIQNLFPYAYPYRMFHKDHGNLATELVAQDEMKDDFHNQVVQLDTNFLDTYIDRRIVGQALQFAGLALSDPDDEKYAELVKKYHRIQLQKTKNTTPRHIEIQTILEETTTDINEGYDSVHRHLAWMSEVRVVPPDALVSRLYKDGESDNEKWKLGEMRIRLPAIVDQILCESMGQDLNAQDIYHMLESTLSHNNFARTLREQEGSQAPHESWRGISSDDYVIDAAMSHKQEALRVINDVLCRPEEFDLYTTDF